MLCSDSLATVSKVPCRLKLKMYSCLEFKKRGVSLRMFPFSGALPFVMSRRQPTIPPHLQPSVEFEVTLFLTQWKLKITSASRKLIARVSFLAGGCKHRANTCWFQACFMSFSLARLW